MLPIILYQDKSGTLYFTLNANLHFQEHVAAYNITEAQYKGLNVANANA